MRSFHGKLFRSSFIFLCFFALAIAGCQKDKENEAGNDNQNAADSTTAKNGDHNENAIILNDENGNSYNPPIDSANFVSTINHPYFTLTPGKIWIYQGANAGGDTERVEVEVTNETKMVMGVATTVVRAREWVNGELVEDTFDWYAQDKEGNVWYFGEESKEIENGAVTSTEGSWEAGVNGAKPGMIMKANPQAGDAYRQEFLKSEAEDMGQVLSVDDSVSIGLGSYQNCVRIKDWSPLEPNVVEHKYYSKETGNVILEKKVEGGSGQMELIEMKSE